MTWAERILKGIEPEDNPRNTVYGALAAGLLAAAEDPGTETYPRVVTATVVEPRIPSVPPVMLAAELLVTVR